MPKAKTRRRNAARSSSAGTTVTLRSASKVATVTNSRNAVSADEVTNAQYGDGANAGASRRAAFPGVRPARSQNAVMPALIALGCWGLAISFSLFSTEPNHYLYGAIAALMGLMWTLNMVLRMRRASAASRSTSMSRSAAPSLSQRRSLRP